MIQWPGAASTLQSISQPADDLMIFRMNQHDGLFASGRFEHVEDLPIVEPHGVIGHIDLDAGVTAANERRQFLSQHSRRRIADNQVKGIIRDRLTLGSAMIILDCGNQGFPPMLDAEGDDRGRPTEGRADAA